MATAAVTTRLQPSAGRTAPRARLRAAPAPPHQHEPRVLARVRLELAHHERFRLGAAAPVDEARVVAGSVAPEVVEIVTPAPAPRRRVAALAEPAERLRGDRAHRREDDHLVGERGPPRLHEEAEGEARGDAHPGEPVAAAPGQRLLPGGEALEPRLDPPNVDEARAGL